MLKRRDLLTGTGAVTVAALAGCTGDSDNDPAPSNNSNSSDSTNDESPNQSDPTDNVIAELGEPQRGSMFYECGNGVISDDFSPSIELNLQQIAMVGMFALDHDGEELHPTVKRVEQDSDAGTITVTTAFTDEVPERESSFREETQSDPESCEYQHTGGQFILSVEDQTDSFPAGTNVYWNVEYPDGSVDESVAEGTVQDPRSR